MPNIADHHSNQAVKLLLLGHGGSGKTGHLGTLAKSHKLFIADFDNGTDILEDPKVLPIELRKNVFYKTFYDKTSIIQGKPLRTHTSIPDFYSSIGRWMEEIDGQKTDLGNIYTWGPDVTFVLDSLTFFGDAALNYGRELNARGEKNARPNDKLQIQDYGSAVDMVETLVETLYNPAVKCNVIVTAHLIPLEDALSGGVIKLLPSAIGKKLPPKIGRFFNTVVLLEKSGFGNNVVFKLHTQALHNTDLKVSKPSKVPSVMEPDLDKLFSLLRET